MKQSKTLKNQRDFKRTIIRSKTQKRCQYQQQNLQNRARSTLCELSENTYHSELVERNKKFFEKREKYGCSPWEHKYQVQNWDNNNCNSKARKDDKAVSNNRQQANCKQQLHRNEANFDYKKYTSIFSKLKEAKLMKQCHNQQNSLNTTIMLQRQFGVKIKNQNMQKRGRIIGSLYKKLQDVQVIKKKSLNRITSCCLIDLQEQKPNTKKQDNVIQDHWKKRNRSLKRKSTRKIKQNVEVTNKPYKIQYKSSNPFTKVLYQKYMKAVKILGDSKIGNFHFL